MAFLVEAGEKLGKRITLHAHGDLSPHRARESQFLEQEMNDIIKELLK